MDIESMKLECEGLDDEDGDEQEAAAPAAPAPDLRVMVIRAFGELTNSERAQVYGCLFERYCPECGASHETCACEHVTRS